MTKRTGKKSLSLDIPVDLFNMYAKLCIDLGITKTEGITQYFQYLQAIYHRQRDILNEKSDASFKLDARKSK
jgi:hypothetical protein